jgi:hypothetical protein
MEREEVNEGQGEEGDERSESRTFDQLQGHI